MCVANEEKVKSNILLGTHYSRNQLPACVLPANRWLKPQTTGGWSLLTCTYTSGFELDKLEVAVEGWSPGKNEPKLSFPGETWSDQEMSKIDPCHITAEEKVI